MKKRFEVIRGEIRRGTCSSHYKISHASGFHLFQVKVVDKKTSNILWFCNKCIRKLGYRDIAHELAQKDKMFWQKERKELKSSIILKKH